MQDASYLRSQADLCFAIARQVSDRAEADRLRSRAADYLARADELDSRNPSPSSHNGAPKGRGEA